MRHAAWPLSSIDEAPYLVENVAEKYTYRLELKYNIKDKK
jgi:hypothetical protein